MPETRAQQRQREAGNCLDPSASGSYHSPVPALCMETVSRLPAIYFEKLLENSPDIVVAVDRKGIIIFYNDGARSTLGYSPEEVLGQHVTRLYPDKSEARKVMTAMREGYGADVKGQVRNFETVFVAKSGVLLPVAISGSVIQTDAGEELGSIGFAKDLGAIRRHDRLATLGEVAIGVAHEINNPLEVIVNNLNLVEKHVARVSSDEDFIIEAGLRFDLQRHRAHQHIVNKLNDLAQGTEYATRQYLPGTMTDLGGGMPVAADGGLDRAGRRARSELAGVRILVVDDDLGVCQSLRDLLTQEGCDVLVATGGGEGLAKLDTEAVDLVLSDVVMPDLDGSELFQEIRVRHHGLPVVLMTAFHFDKDHIIKRSKLAGLDDVVYKKPIDPQKLRALIKRHARRPDSVFA